MICSVVKAKLVVRVAATFRLVASSVGVTIELS